MRLNIVSGSFGNVDRPDTMDSTLRQSILAIRAFPWTTEDDCWEE